MLQHDAFSQTARFERFAANLLYTIAAGKQIDPDKAERFGTQVDEVYKNPFTYHEEQPMTAAEIKQHLLDKIHELRTGG